MPTPQHPAYTVGSCDAMRILQEANMGLKPPKGRC
jgi:hypothetical protein